jgi:hypothetical protein
MRSLCAALALLAAACGNGVTCDTRTDDVGEVCIPSTIAPGIPSQIDVRELCSPGCTDPANCSALFRNGSVVLDVEQDVCSDSFTSSCVALGCQQRTVRCTLPPLAAGQYALIIPGGPPHLLRVQPGGSSSCRFPSADGGVQ